jgi:tetratricopeptide (TPR) repeat protein
VDSRFAVQLTSLGWHKLATVLTVIGSLTACATAPSQPPVVDQSQSAPIQREPVVTGKNDKSEPPIQSTAATASLLAAAASERANKNFDNAITYLERAVRIDPRNSTLWVELSNAHLANNDLNAANQHVRKAIALAGSDPVLLRQAWLQLADIREAEGNMSEARAIRRRYEAIRG